MKDDSTVPPSMIDWADHADRALSSLSQAPAPDSEAIRDWKTYEHDRFAQQLRRNSLPDSIDALRLQIRNVSDHSITGLRIRLDYIYGVWDITAGGTFLSHEEIQSFLKLTEISPRSNSIVLPEIPTLPEHSNFVITVYGGVRNAEVFVTGGSSKSRIVDTLKFEDRGIISFINNPAFRVLTGAAIITLLGTWLANWISGIAARRERRSIQSNPQAENSPKGTE